jgi:DNA-binding SARP family transcriptional activator/Tfp pilus assembly protein PilF
MLTVSDDHPSQGDHTQVAMRVLGCFEVLCQGRPVSVGGTLPQALLARLLVSDGVVSADELVEDVWAGHPPARAQASLHAYVSRLRGVLGPDLIEHVHHGYRLDRSLVLVDASVFEDLLRRGGRAWSQGDLAGAADLLDAALHQWRGPTAFGPQRRCAFVNPEAHRLEELRLTVLEQLADVRTSLGQQERTLPLLTEQVALTPLRESLVARLMRALAAAGRPGEAAAAYETCREALTEELGVEPGLELRQELSRLTAASDVRAPWRLPSRNRMFTGREALIGRALQVLQEPGAGPAIITLYGMPGVGKTELALEIAHRRRQENRLAWWVRADGPATMTTGLADLAHALGLPRRARQEELITALWDELARRGRWLIVFDNVDDPEVLSDVLPPVGDGEVIVTSRNPAWRSLGPTVQVLAFDREESRAFVAARTGERDVVLLEALVEALADLPLALEHACAYLDQTGVGVRGYLDLLDRRQDLWFSARPVSGRRPSVATTWAVAFDRVRQRSPAAAELLELFAFLAPDAVPVDLFRADGTDELTVNERLAELLRLSLVDREFDAVRTHRLVQAVARAGLQPVDRERRLATAIDLVARAAAARRPDDWGDLVPQVLALTDHLVDTSGAHPATGRLVELAVPCALWMADRALFPAAIDELDKAVRLARGSGDRIAEGCVLSALGEVVDRAGDWAAARTHLEPAVVILDRVLPATDARRAHAHNRLGHVLNCAGEWPSAVAAHRRAIALLRGSSDRARLAAVLTDLGYTYWGAGDLRPAREAFEDSLAILADLRDVRPLVAHTHAGLGLVEQDCGALVDACARQRRALEEFQVEYGPLHPDVAQSWDKLGYVQRLLGDHAAAVASHERAVADLETIFGARDPRVAMALTNAGLAYRAAGRAQQAREAQERAHAIFRVRSGESHPSTLMTARRLAVARVEDGAPQAARSLAENALRVVRRTRGDDTAERALAEADLATVLDALGEEVAARAHRAQALRVLTGVLGPEHHEVTALAALVEADVEADAAAVRT